MATAEQGVKMTARRYLTRAFEAEAKLDQFKSGALV